jgi:hypothetical protein
MQDRRIDLVVFHTRMRIARIEEESLLRTALSMALLTGQSKDPQRTMGIGHFRVCVPGVIECRQISADLYIPPHPTSPEQTSLQRSRDGLTDGRERDQHQHPVQHALSPSPPLFVERQALRGYHAELSCRTDVLIHSHRACCQLWSPSCGVPPSLYS